MDWCHFWVKILPKSYQIMHLIFRIPICSLLHSYHPSLDSKQEPKLRLKFICNQPFCWILCNEILQSHPTTSLQTPNSIQDSCPYSCYAAWPWRRSRIYGCKCQNEFNELQNYVVQCTNSVYLRTGTLGDRVDCYANSLCEACIPKKVEQDPKTYC